MNNNTQDVIIIGAGASGSALAFALARYTTISKIMIVEKYAKPGQVNSKASNNSQTLHVGDIETNYDLGRIRDVHPAAMMTVHYAEMLPQEERKRILQVVPKMVLGVGEAEVALLEKRFSEISHLFPELEKKYGPALATLEPALMKGRTINEPVLALYNPLGYAVNFEALAASFIAEAEKNDEQLIVRYNTKVDKIEKDPDGIYSVYFEDGKVARARVVVVNADSYSLLFAKQLGYGKNFSLIPIAGNFYFTQKLLHSKVYTVQKPELPFAAVHGDPDIQHPDLTRWGPTARFKMILESHTSGTFLDYLRSSGLGKWKTWKSFAKILLKKVLRVYLIKNMLYELPWIGKMLFVSNVRKIVPSIKAADVRVAKGFGGMRLQRVDTDTHELKLGEGKIVGDNIIFNMTPSPGASVALYNAYRDAEQVVAFLGNEVFRKGDMQMELLKEDAHAEKDVSIPAGYSA